MPEVATTSDLPDRSVAATPFDIRPIGVLLLVTLPFWLAVTFPFLQIDDPQYILTNPHVLAGLTPNSIRWAFTATTPSYWMPLSWLSLMLDVTLFGAGPEGLHFTNILLHTANAILVYLFLHTLTKSTGRCLLIAALFAIHPLRIESVAWITERKDVLSLFLGLLSLLAYVHYVRSSAFRRSSLYAISILLYALSLMSKPTLVTLPLLLFLLDNWPLARLTGLQNPPTNSLRGPSRLRVFVFRSVLLEKLPFLTLAAISAYLTAHTVQSRNIATAIPPLLLRCQTALVSIALYLRDTFYFGRLSIFYPQPDQIPIWQILAAGVLLCSLALALLFAHRKSTADARPLLVGACWFLLTLAPTLGILYCGDQSRADRFTYLPSIGLFLALVYLFPQSKIKNQKSKIILATASILILATFTTLHLQLWQHPLDLYRSGLAHTDRNWLLESRVAAELHQQNQLPDALSHYARALDYKPDSLEALTGMAIALDQSGCLSEALPLFRRAHELAPQNPQIEANYREALAKAFSIRNNSPSPDR